MSARNAIQVPLPDVASYSAEGESIYKYFTASVAGIKSPVAFEGSALELVADTLLARPSRYDFELVAVKFAEE